MKKSNKILLGGLLTVILIIVAVHVALYARYKAGYYTPFNQKETATASNVKTFANAHHIDIRYFRNVSIQVGEQMRIEPYGFDENELVITEKGGMVQLAPRDSANGDDLYGYMLIHVPANSLVTAHNATIRVEGQDGKKIKSLHFNVTGGRLTFKQRENMVQIDSLNVEAANRAIIELQNTHINKLSVQLNASELIDQQAIINQLKLNADGASRINLQSKNLLNLTTKTTAHE
jgi:hypothetical protein